MTEAVRQAADGSCTGAAVDLGGVATYTVATNDFMANGGDGYPVVIAKATTREFIDQVVADHVEAAGTISPSIQGRTNASGLPVPYPHPEGAMRVTVRRVVTLIQLRSVRV